MEDPGLVAAALDGDGAAFAAIYDRYADRIHDFCWSVLRDREEAADAMQDTFVLAAERLGQLRDTTKLRPWLFAIARNEAIKRGRARQRFGPGRAEVADVESPAAGPEEVAGREELAQIVWQAAAGLSERDRVILDLHLRQGLDGQELADALGVETSHAYVLLTRLRDQVERSLGALLVARQGRKDCPELHKMLSGWDGRLSALVRKKVARHVDNCDVCADRRRSSVTPLALLSAVPLLPAPPQIRREVLARFELTSHDGPPWVGGVGGFPPPIDLARQPRSRLAIWSAAAAVVAVIVGLLGMQPWEGQTQSVEAVDVGSSVSSTTAPLSQTVPTAPAAVGNEEPGSTLSTSGVGGTSVPTVNLGPPPTTGPDSPANPNGPEAPVDQGGLAEPSVTTTSTTSSTSTTTVADRRPPAVTARVTPASLLQQGCSGSMATVLAMASDASGLSAVILNWVAPNGASGSATMSPRGDSYAATLGPFAAGGDNTASWWVTATDVSGNTASTNKATIAVGPCAQ